MDWPNPDTIPGISDHQRGQLRRAFSGGNIAALTGGPGTGKTFTTAAVIRAIKRDHAMATIGVGCPTGKASVRASEALAERRVYLTARTNHSMLVPTKTGYDGNGWAFEHNETNPLPFEMLNLDEFSMPDTDICASLVAAIDPGTKILLVGDPDQLSPVGHGRPFVDLLRWGIPHGHLTEIHRYAGRIAHVCAAIRDGEPWEPSPRLDWQREENPENLKLFDLKPKFHRGPIQASQYYGVIEAVIDKVVNGRGFNPIDDVQVICALNDSGPLSRKPLNELMQKLLNPHGRKVEGNKFAVGDKVICLKNQWMTAGEDDESGRSQLYIANGEIGEVLKVEKTWLEARFGNWIVRVPKGAWDQVDLAYAITVHKAQGSQAPVVIVVADDSYAANMICSRSWWYTSVSRASKLCVIVGPRETIDRHCRKVDVARRKTFLVELLGEKVA